MPAKLPNIQACVFEAYGTLFDVNSAASIAQSSAAAACCGAGPTTRVLPTLFRASVGRV